MADEKNMEVEEVDTLELEDEDGNVIRYEFLESVEYKGENYAILLPFEPEDEEDAETVYIYKETPIEGETDLADYTEVLDDEVLEAVFNLFVKIMDEKYPEED